MPSFPQALPSTDSAAATIARRILVLKGPAIQAPDGSLNAADALALGAILETARETLAAARAQAFVCDATYMLSELEALYGLSVDASVPDATRQARLLAFVRAAISGVPASIEAAVAALSGTCTVVETNIVAVMASDPTPDADTARGVFQFAVVVPLAVASSAPQVAQITAVVDRMKPAHTSFAVTNQTTGFLTDSPTSLTDVTVLGS